MTVAVDELAPMPPELLWGFLPKPIAVVLAVILAIAYVVTEVTGKLNGPLSKLLARRDQKRQARVTGWAERDRRVEELEGALAIQERTMIRLENRISSYEDQLDVLHRYSDAQSRAIRRHIEWDRLWSERARLAGINVPEPPPSLWVELDDIDNEEAKGSDQLTP